MRSRAWALSGYATKPKQALSGPPHPGTATYETPTASSTHSNQHPARRRAENHDQPTTQPPPAHSPTNHRSEGKPRTDGSGPGGYGLVVGAGGDSPVVAARWWGMV